MGAMVTVLLLTTVGFGQQGPKAKGWSMSKAPALELTDAQKTKIAAIKADYAPKFIDAKATLAKHQIAMKQLHNADKPNKRAINAAIDDGF